MSTDDSSQYLRKAVDRVVEEVGEHADCVVVMAMIHDTETKEDHKYVHGSGSQYTRHAMVEEVYLKWREYVKTHARIMQERETPPPPPPEEEE